MASVSIHGMSNNTILYNTKPTEGVHDIYTLYDSSTYWTVHFMKNCTLTLYDPGGGGALKAPPPPLRLFALTHLILELQYCALGTFLKK